MKVSWRTSDVARVLAIALIVSTMTVTTVPAMLGGLPQRNKHTTAGNRGSKDGSGTGCGVERQKVKTSLPATLVVETGTVALLRTFSPPSKAQFKQYATKRMPHENAIYSVAAVLVGYKLEADQDYHLVLAEPGQPAQTMIAEIPAPVCLADAQLKAQAVAARQFVDRMGKAGRYRKLKVPLPVRVTGALFFDFLHGQTGVAKNGVELHPVVAIEKR